MTKPVDAGSHSCGPELVSDAQGLLGSFVAMWVHFVTLAIAGLSVQSGLLFRCLPVNHRHFVWFASQYLTETGVAWAQFTGQDILSMKIPKTGCPDALHFTAESISIKKLVGLRIWHQHPIQTSQPGCYFDARFFR